jgi:hypothetical protein
MDNTGWIKLHRELIDKPIWLKSTPEQKSILITLLLMANHQESQWEWQGVKFEVKPGQFITSLEHIAEKSGKGITVQNVRSSLKKFQDKYQFLTNESTKTGRLITICNWGDYQAKEQETNKDTNNELTKNQQRGNKELTPNKNDKNDKNERNNYPTPFPQNPTKSKLKKWVAENGYPEEFEQLYELSDKKRDKLAALVHWSALSESEREAVRQHWPQYAKLTRNNYQKLFRTYLDDRGWEIDLKSLQPGNTENKTSKRKIYDPSLGF